MCSQDTNIEEWFKFKQAGIDNISEDEAIEIDHLLYEGRANGYCKIGNVHFVFNQPDGMIDKEIVHIMDQVKKGNGKLATVGYYTT